MLAREQRQLPRVVVLRAGERGERFLQALGLRLCGSAGSPVLCCGRLCFRVSHLLGTSQANEGEDFLLNLRQQKLLPRILVKLGFIGVSIISSFYNFHF